MKIKKTKPDMVNGDFGQLALLKVGSDNPSSGGSLAKIHKYDTFGNIVSQDGSSKGNLRFQGKYFDRESGIYYYYHRYYKPLAGRFINEYPLRFSGSYNFYVFTTDRLAAGVFASAPMLKSCCPVPAPGAHRWPVASCQWPVPFNTKF